MHHYSEYHTLAVFISVLGVALVAVLGYLIVRFFFGVPIGKLFALLLASSDEELPRGLDQYAARIAEDVKKGKIRYS
jgi:hypothetical protein